MEMWEFVIEADRELDLANPSHGRQWFGGSKSWYALNLPPENRPALDQGVKREWSEPVQKEWEKGIRALRFIASEEKKHKTRKPGIAPEEARGVLLHYVQQLHLTVAPGLVAYPRVVAPIRAAFDNMDEIYTVAVSMFFQRVFATMLLYESGVAPVCGRCGRQMERTSTGRVSRAKHCPACKVWISNHEKSEKERRERWKKDQQKKRKLDALSSREMA